MLARLLNKSIKIVKMLFTLIIFICVVGAVLIFFFSQPPKTGKGQVVKPYHPVATLFHIDSTRLDSLQKQTAKDSVKATKVMRKVVSVVQEQAKELEAVKDTLTAITAVQVLINGQ